ncbi:MAG TPA: hypothetical protein PKH65_08060 [Bacteroidia bacterium]|nr:hypothetical protein [Bacteroidia bacterium]HNT80620.1 hypothetical protein [Bacteroidia bacterium]
MSRKHLFFLLASLFLISHASHAQQVGGFGAGIIIGEPTGLSGKLFMSERNAVDFALAWSFADDAALHLHSDYLVHNYDLIHVSYGKLPLFYGIGGRLKLADKSRLGLRVPVGLAYLFDEDPFEVFIELVPLLDLIPVTSFTINGGIGVRYYF